MTGETPSEKEADSVFRVFKESSTNTHIGERERKRTKKPNSACMDACVHVIHIDNKTDLFIFITEVGQG